MTYGKKAYGTAAYGTAGLSGMPNPAGSFTATAAFSSKLTIQLNGSFAASAAFAAFSSRGGSMVVSTATGLGGYPVKPNLIYTAVASFRANAGGTGRSCTLGINWYNAAGASVSGSLTGPAITDGTAFATQASVSGTSPAGAAFAALVGTVSSPRELHFLTNADLNLGTNTTWGPGGYSGLSNAIVQRSDSLYVRNASTSTPASVAANSNLVVSDYECVPLTAYGYSAYMIVTVGGNTLVSNSASTSSSASVVTTKWWEIIPASVSTATSAQLIDWTAATSEQGTAHFVMGQTTPNVVASNMGGMDGTGTFETFSPIIYQALQTILQSQSTIFMSSPWGASDSGYVRFGPATNSPGNSGQTVKSSQLLPSSYNAMHRLTAVTWVAQARPPV